MSSGGEGGERGGGRKNGKMLEYPAVTYVEVEERMEKEREKIKGGEGGENEGGEKRSGGKRTRRRGTVDTEEGVKVQKEKREREEEGEEGGREEEEKMERNSLTLNLLPYGKGPWSQNVASTYIIVLHHLCLCDHLRIPLTEVLLLSDLQTQPGREGGVEGGKVERGE